MHCLCCFAQIRKHLHFASMATQQGNLYESTLETNEDLKIILNQAEDFNLSLQSNPENSQCLRFFNLMLKNYFVTWWAESCSSDFSTFPLLLDSTTPWQWSLNTKRQKNPPSTLEQNSRFACSTNSVANATVYTKIRSTRLSAFFQVMFQILTSSISRVSADSKHNNSAQYGLSLFYVLA